MAVYPYTSWEDSGRRTQKDEVLGGVIKCTLLVFYTLYLNFPVAFAHIHYFVFASLFVPAPFNIYANVCWSMCMLFGVSGEFTQFCAFKFLIKFKKSNVCGVICYIFMIICLAL